jgi:hypothetical protein
MCSGCAYVSPTGGGAFGYEVNEPEHARGAGWAGIKIKFDSPLGHKLEDEY